MARLELAGLTACGPDGRAPVLREVSLAVPDGELLAVLGPGRSTLLRAVIGLAEVLDGAILLDGRDVTELLPGRRNLAMVFQDAAPYPHLGVRDNLALPLRLAGLAPAEVARRVAGVAAELELTVHLDRMPGQLSRGQRQRLAIGRVLVRPDPAAYLLDEPLAAAEEAVRPRLRALLTGTGRTTVWACADAAEAAALGGRVAVLRDGRLEQVGTPRELAEHPASLEIAALAPLTVLPGTAEDGAVRTPLGVLPVRADRAAVLVGIRPADLTGTGPGVRLSLLAGEAGTPGGGAPDGTPGGAPDGAPAGTARLRHPALDRAAEQDPRLSRVVLARVDPAGRRAVTVYLDPSRVLLFDPTTGAALPR